MIQEVLIYKTYDFSQLVTVWLCYNNPVKAINLQITDDVNGHFHDYEKEHK